MILTQKTIGIKFNGDFKKLKSCGYTFVKKYRISWHKVIVEPGVVFHIWVWCSGRSIEVESWFNCTTAVVEKLKSIDFWDEIKPCSWSGRKYVTLYWEHCRPEVGVEIVKGNDPRTNEENSKYQHLTKAVFSFESVQRLLKELEMLENL